MTKDNLKINNFVKGLWKKHDCHQKITGKKKSMNCVWSKKKSGVKGSLKKMNYIKKIADVNYVRELQNKYKFYQRIIEKIQMSSKDHN